MASCAASAGIHAGLVPSHIGESVSLGVAFIGASVALLVLALAVSLSPAGVARRIAPAAVLLMALLIAAYAVSRTLGLPFGGEGVEELDALGVLTQGIQVVGLGAAVRLTGPATADRRAALPKERLT